MSSVAQPQGEVKKWRVIVFVIVGGLLALLALYSGVGDLLLLDGQSGFPSEVHRWHVALADCSTYTHVEHGKGVKKMVSILWAIVVVLVVLWLLGLLLHVAGGFIHLLLIIAAIVLVYNLIMGARARRL